MIFRRTVHFISLNVMSLGRWEVGGGTDGLKTRTLANWCSELSPLVVLETEHDATLPAKQFKNRIADLWDATE